MLLRNPDPFRDLERLASQLLGSPARPAAMPMDAWRRGDTFVLEFDIPGVRAEDIDLNIERNVLTLRTERPAADQDRQTLAAERPRGSHTRQLVLGDNLDLDRVQAHYDAGVLRLSIPVSERAKPRRIEIGAADQEGRVPIGA